MFQQILVPLDGSACSEQALVLAARLARAVDGTLYLLRIANQEYTYESTSVAGVFVPADLAEMTDLEMKGDHAYLDKIANLPLLAGLNVVKEVRAELAIPEAILNFITSHHMEIVVMGSHGRGGLARLVLGSVAQKIAWNSPVPVLVHRVQKPEQDEQISELATPMHALVPLDGSPQAEEAIVPAGLLVAALSGAGVGSLHLVQIIKLSAYHTDEQRRQAYEEAEQYLQDLAGRLRRVLASTFQIEIKSSVFTDDQVAPALVQIAASGDGAAAPHNLIAMTTSGRGGKRRFIMGSVAEHILQKTPLPVLLIKPDETSEQRKDS